MVRQLPATLKNLSAILSIADAVPVMIAFCDQDEIYRFCNQPIADWFERPREEIIGRTIEEVMGSDAYAGRREAMAKARAGERQWVTAAFDHPSRGPLITEAEYIPHFDTDGTQSGVVMVVRDVTREKADEAELNRRVEKATRELAASEARFRAMFDTVRASIILLDPEGRIIDVNATGGAFRDGREPPRPGQYLWEAAAVRDEHKDIIREMAAKVARGDSETREFEIETEKHGRMVLDCDMRPILDGETVRYILFEVRDVSELKLAQDQLRQAQKMEALGQLTGGIAHDFNNLLTVVVGGLDFVVKGTSDERMLRYAKAAQSAADRGARLTAQLLAFSRVQRLSVEPTPINRSIEEMQPFLRNVLNPGIDKDIRLLDEEVHVLADPTQLEVALLNLAINARDAMPDGGRLTMAATRRHMPKSSELDEGDYVEIIIGDTGEGMSKETLARAFDPFFTTKAVGKGTGLGLSMVYGMAHQSGGTVLLDSEVGKGTRVSLLLKVADGAIDPARPSDNRADDPSDHDASVLVVDDDEDVRIFIVNSLREAGFSVSEAGSGREALDLYDADGADVVVLDYLMPEMTGADVAAALSTRSRTQPILFVSGYSDTEEIAAASPGAPILTKPFKAEDLVLAVSRLVPAKSA